MSDKVNELIAAISDLSEELWCAGWLRECEYAFWQWMAEDEESVTFAPFRALSDEIGGWVHWPNYWRGFPIGDGPVFVPMDEWLAKFSAWEANRQ